jgi:hypothetical protein
MRLKIKIGYYISYLIITIGIILSIGGFDKNSIITYTGLFLISCAGIFYTHKGRKINNASQDWLRLGGYALIAIGVFIHFIFEIKSGCRLSNK